MALVNKFVRYLTKRHDRRIAGTDSGGNPQLSPAEKIPSAMLAFSIIETKTDEEKVISLLEKIFEKNENVKRQFGAAGENLLFCAYKLGRLKVARFLIDNEVNPLQVTLLGSTHHAALEAFNKSLISFDDFKETSNFLHNIGCDIDAMNHQKMPPFLCAVKEQNLAAMVVYVGLGCDYNLQGPNDQHALHMLCRVESPRMDIFQYLISLPNVSVRSFDASGYSPLYLAADKALTLHPHSDQVVPCTCQLRGEHPSVLRSKIQFVGMCEALLNAGADPSKLTDVRMNRIGLPLSYHLLSVRMHNIMGGIRCTTCETHADMSPSQDFSYAQDTDDMAPSSNSHHHEFIGCDCYCTQVPQQPSGRFSGLSSPATHAVPLSSQLLCSNVLRGRERLSELSTFFRNACSYKTCKHNDPYIDMLRDFIEEQGPALRETPSSLKALSRSAIRIAVLCNGTLMELDKLPLPNILVDFVALKTII